jgi:hypothetical protein
MYGIIHHHLGAVVLLRCEQKEEMPVESLHLDPLSDESEEPFGYFACEV